MRINFSINGVKKYIEPDQVWWGKHWPKVAGAAAAIVLLWVLV